jgi:GGDEF domain-containing protein
MDKDSGPAPIESSRDGRRQGSYAPPRRKGAGEEKPSDQNGHGDHAGSAAPAGHDEAIAVSIAGLPMDKLSPETERVIETLLADLGRLRGELDVARRRLAQLEQVVDHHPFLAILSREAFRRQIAHALERADRLPTTPSLFLVSLLNGDAIRREFGIEARDKALVHLCAALRATLRPDDILGSLTGNDMAALVFAAGDEGSQALSAALVRAIAERPFFWGERRLELSVATGFAALAQGMSSPKPDVESVIAAADADLTAGIRGRT